METLVHFAGKETMLQCTNTAGTSALGWHDQHRVSIMQVTSFEERVSVWENSTAQTNYSDIRLL